MEIVKLFLSQIGLDINSKIEGSSSLHVASYYGHSEVVKLLLEQPNINAEATEHRYAILFNLSLPYFYQFRYGQTALHIACSRGHIKVVELLLPRCQIDVKDR